MKCGSKAPRAAPAEEEEETKKSEKGKVMRCVVTGAAGFIGSNLVETLLGAGHEVLGIDCFINYYPRPIKEKNLEHARSFSRFQLVEADLQSAPLTKLCEGSDCIFHLAAQAGVRDSWGDDFRIYTANNIVASQRLLEAAKSDAVRPTLKKLVYASSSSVYGHAEALPTRETAMPRPVSPYGVSKLAAEHLMVLYAQEFGVPTASLRYFTVYGPRQRPEMAFHRFIKAGVQNESIEVYGDGEQSRDFTFVSDAVAATIGAATAAESGLVCNIGGGSRVTLNEVIRTIGEILGRPLQVVYKARQAGDAKHTSADTSRAAQAFGYRPQVTLAEGLRAEADWIREMLDRP